MTLLKDLANLFKYYLSLLKSRLNFFVERN